MQYPRPVRDIHQIEVTTRCNLRCHYCPHYPKLPRPMVDMERDVWGASMNLVEFYVRQGTQTELSLTGIGESLLHPDFPEMVRDAREVIGPNRPLTVTTNGLLLDDEMCRKIAPYRPQVFISLHRPEKAAFAVESAKKYGILRDVNVSYVTASFDWAGYQKNWTPIQSAPKITCEYLRSGWAVILVDGRIATCCLDATGASVVGTIYDDPNKLMLQPWGTEELGCKACYQAIP